MKQSIKLRHDVKRFQCYQNKVLVNIIVFICVFGIAKIVILKLNREKKKLSQCYFLLWNIINERWDMQLHRPLNVAGYFLNSQMHYLFRFKTNFEVKQGLIECITRIMEDVNEQFSVMFKLKISKNELNVLVVLGY